MKAQPKKGLHISAFQPGAKVCRLKPIRATQTVSELVMLIVSTDIRELSFLRDQPGIYKGIANNCICIKVGKAIERLPIEYWDDDGWDLWEEPETKQKVTEEINQTLHGKADNAG